MYLSNNRRRTDVMCQLGCYSRTDRTSTMIALTVDTSQSNLNNYLFSRKKIVNSREKRLLERRPTNAATTITANLLTVTSAQQFNTACSSLELHCLARSSLHRHGWTCRVITVIIHWFGLSQWLRISVLLEMYRGGTDDHCYGLIGKLWILKMQ